MYINRGGFILVVFCRDGFFGIFFGIGSWINRYLGGWNNSEGIFCYSYGRDLRWCLVFGVAWVGVVCFVCGV